MILDQDAAHRIAKKLGANVRQGRKHARAEIIHKGQLVAHYGIRRASKPVHHGYIPQQLYISPGQARNLSECPMSAQEYFDVLKEKGLISDSAD